MSTSSPPTDVHKHELAPEKMPGHWLLARMGKRVLRPGGLELTRQMLDALDIQPADHVVELAPGLGVTARMTLQKNPATYTAVERDATAAATVRGYLTEPHRQCILGTAEATGLPAESASVVYGEAMLSMQPAPAKGRIIQEAHRLLHAGGRYGIHELCLVPDDLDQQIRQDIERDLSGEIHVGVRPLTTAEWRTLLADAGFEVDREVLAPMHLLEPGRLFRDEGFGRALKFMWNVACHSAARRRVRAMRRIFRKYRQHLAAIALVSRKPTATAP